MLSLNQYNQIKEQAFAGVPSILDGVCKVYPYTMREIIEIGSNRYYSFVGTLLLTKDDIGNIIKEKTGTKPKEDEIPDTLTYLIQSANISDTFLLELQIIFSTFLKEEVIILPELNAIVIGDPSERRLITIENFEDLQTILRLQHRREVPTPPPPDETPGERKMRLLREKAAAVKRKQAQKKGEGQTLFEMLEIAETYGITLDHSVYAFYALIQRHQYKEKWQQDIQMLCAGADSTKLKTKYWGESLNNE